MNADELLKTVKRDKFKAPAGTPTDKQKQFVQKSRAAHDNRYDYSKAVYTASNKKVVIICPSHGEFEQVARSHMTGSGCVACYLERNTKYKNTDAFIELARAMHGDRYDYSQSVVPTANGITTIVCRTHGPFEQRYRNHVANGNGCAKCAHENRG